MNPEDYIFYRLDLANEFVKGIMPSKITYQQMRSYVTSTRVRAQLLNGRRVRTRFGIYWMEPKVKTV